MAYSSIETTKNQKRAIPKDFNFGVPSNTRSANVNNNALAHIYLRGWNVVSFPRICNYVNFSDLYAQQPLITKIKTKDYLLTRDGTSDNWVGDSEISSMDYTKSYSVWSDSEVPLPLSFLGYNLKTSQYEWHIKNKKDLYSVPYSVTDPNDIFAFDNSSQSLRSSGSGVGTATTALTVADGDASISGIAEKQYLEIKAYSTTVNAEGYETLVSKKYVICDGGQPGCVATGTVLVEGSDTGGGTIGAGSHLIGGIAVSADLGPATYGVIINELRTAIMHANGHNGNIVCGEAVTPADGSQSISLTQLIKGTRGNTFVTNTIANVTVNNFSGGSAGTGPLVHYVVGEGGVSVWDSNINKFVGNANFNINRGVIIGFYDKPERDIKRLFRHQGPDMSHSRFADFVSPTGSGQMASPDFLGVDGYWVFDEGAEGNMNTPSSWYFVYYSQGHWSYYNDGEPDEDYPAQPGDDAYGTYRLWVEGGEWLPFAIGDSVAYYGVDGELLDADQFIDTRYWEARHLGVIPGVSGSGLHYEGGPFQFWLGYMQSFIFSESNPDITTNKAPMIEWDGDEETEPHFDVFGIFNGEMCHGANNPYYTTSYGGDESDFEQYLSTGGEAHLMTPIQNLLNAVPEPGVGDMNQSVVDEMYNGITTFQSAGTAIISTVADGSNFPSDESVTLVLTSTLSGTTRTRNYILSNSDGYVSGNDYKVNANQTRTNFFTSLKTAIEHSNGHGGFISASVDADNGLISMTQVEMGSHNNTLVVWEGATSGMVGNVTTNGNWSFDAESTLNGAFYGGGVGDILKWVCWNASTQKYHKMKWHHYNASTEVETKYEYYQLQEMLDGDLAQPAIDPYEGSTSDDFPAMTDTEGGDYFGCPVSAPSQYGFFFHIHNKDGSRWYLKAVPQEEGW